MDGDLDRFFLLLIIMGFTNTEIDQLATSFKVLNALEISERTKFLRRQLGPNAVPWPKQRGLANKRKPSTERPRSKPGRGVSSKVAIRIEQLLREDAKLSVEQAYQLLLGAFPEARQEELGIPGKSGFRNWLLRFLLIISESDVLRFLETYTGRSRLGIEPDWTIGT